MKYNVLPSRAHRGLSGHAWSAGSVIAAGAFTAIGVGVVRAMPLLLIVAAIMALVALLATLGPARRGVRVPAIEALRAEA